MFILKIIFSILLSPLAAYLQVGLSPHFWINLILWLLGFGLMFFLFIPIPLLAVIHALWLVIGARKA